jgi:hypothetical protein
VSHVLKVGLALGSTVPAVFEWLDELEPHAAANNPMMDRPTEIGRRRALV